MYYCHIQSQMPVLQSVTTEPPPSFPSLPTPQLVNPDDPVSDLELTNCSRHLHHKLQELVVLLDISDDKVKEIKGRFKTSQLQALGLLRCTTLTHRQLYDLLQALELPEAANELRNDSSSSTNTQSQTPALTYQDDSTERTEELFTDKRHHHHEKQVKPKGIDHNGSNPHHILKSHSTSILDAISDTTMLANDLSSVNLITDAVKDEVLTTNLSRYKGASILMNEVQRSLNVFNKSERLEAF